MKIFIAHNFSDFSYAASSRALAVHLAERGHQVLFFSHETPVESPEVNGLDIHQWPEKRPTGWKSYMAAYTAMRSFKPNVVVAHAAALNVVGLVARICRVPHRYAYYHSAYEAGLMDIPYPKWIQMLLRHRKRFFYKCFNHFIAVSAFASRDIQHWFNISENQITVIHNALDDRWNHEQAGTKPAQPPVVFFLPGRLDKGKNIAAVVRGFLSFRGRNPNTLLQIAGAGPDAAWVKQVADNKTGVQYLGSLPYHDMDKMMQAAHVIVCSSLAEAFGMVNLEASMNATPVLASNVGGIPEVVKHEFNGWLIDDQTAAGWEQGFDKAFQVVTSMPEQYDQMRRNGRMIFESTFTREIQVRKLSKLLLNEGAS